MNLKQISKDQMPVVATREGLKITMGGIDALKGKGEQRVTYGLADGDVFEFPETIEDVKTVSRQVRKNSDAFEVLILGLKNGEPGYLSVANLRRYDYKMKPVHPVAEALMNCEDDAARVTECLGKTIKAEGTIEYQRYAYKDGVRTDVLQTVSTVNLVFE